MIHISIFDHKRSFAEMLSDKIHLELEQLYIDTDITIFSSETALLEAADQDVQLYLLDILPNDFPVLSLAEQLLERCPDSSFIFMSDYPDTVFSCLPYHPLFFIRKNKLSEDFPGAVQAMIRTLAGSNSSIRLHTAEGDMRLPASEIIYIESNAHYLNLYCSNAVYRVRGKLSDYYPRLMLHDFIQPAKSFLVNCRHILHFHAEEIRTTNGSIPVSREKKTAARRAYLDYIQRTHGN